MRENGRSGFWGRGRGILLELGEIVLEEFADRDDHFVVGVVEDVPDAPRAVFDDESDDQPGRLFVRLIFRVEHGKRDRRFSALRGFGLNRDCEIPDSAVVLTTANRIRIYRRDVIGAVGRDVGVFERQKRRVEVEAGVGAVEFNASAFVLVVTVDGDQKGFGRGGILGVRWDGENCCRDKKRDEAKNLYGHERRASGNGGGSRSFYAEAKFKDAEFPMGGPWTQFSNRDQAADSCNCKSPAGRPASGRATRMRSSPTSSRISWT